VVKALKSIDENVSGLITSIMNGRPRPDSAGLLAAEVALLRLKSSFRSALILISQAHAFEAAAVVRLALEQIAWPMPSIIATIKKEFFAYGHQSGFIFESSGAVCRAALRSPKQAGACRAWESDDLLRRRGRRGSVEIRYQLSDESFVVLGYLLGVLGLFRR